MDEILEQMMCLIKILAELAPPFLGIFAQHGERSFVLPGGVQFDIDILLLQEAVQVRDLRHHANGSQGSQTAPRQFCSPREPSL